MLFRSRIELKIRPGADFELDARAASMTSPRGGVFLLRLEGQADADGRAGGSGVAEGDRVLAGRQRERSGVTRATLKPKSLGTQAWACLSELDQFKIV